MLKPPLTSPSSADDEAGGVADESQEVEEVEGLAMWEEAVSQTKNVGEGMGANDVPSDE